MTCDNCKQRPGTERWVGEGSAMDYIHGAWRYWCKLCVARAQLAHAKKMADTIPELEQTVAALEAQG